MSEPAPTRRARRFYETKDATRDYLFGGPGRDRGSYDLYRDHVESVERHVAE